ncbi:MAG: DUF3606 domain-containing protein [Pseudomonadota bacterium]|nr:DUF3606 domain-containing protein [Pseudomonadota bacterium]
MSEARISVDEEPRAKDHWSVNLAESWEIFFWTRELSCSEDELRRAVAAVGATARDVRAHLADRQRTH